MIRFEDVAKIYPGKQVALSQVSFTVNKGEFYFITGHSGAGKSTLLKLIAALEKPTSGRIFLGQHCLNSVPVLQVPYLRRQVGFVFQTPSLLEELSVYHNVALPLHILGLHPREMRRRVRAALDKVGLLHKEKRLPMTLSGGEQQRVGIARAVVNKPALILADEPTGNLDPSLSCEILQLFQEFNRVGVTLLIATHDTTLIQQFQQSVFSLENGRLLAQTQTQTQAQPQIQVPIQSQALSMEQTQLQSSVGDDKY
jgi:cell division transport system ATP-binding protein